MNVIDVEGLRRMSGYDETFVLEILKLYTERSSKDVEELEKARSEEDRKTIQFVVHRMRSAAVPLGLKELVVLLKKVELKIKDDDNHDIGNELDAILEITRSAMEDARKQLNVVWKIHIKIII